MLCKVDLVTLPIRHQYLEASWIVEYYLWWYDMRYLVMQLGMVLGS